jgi:hypothetical protein
MTEQEKAFWEIWDKIEPHHENYNHRQMFDFGYRAAVQRILEWIEDNRSAIELEPGERLYRDHFRSEDLVAFIKEERK